MKIFSLDKNQDVTAGIMEQISAGGKSGMFSAIGALSSATIKVYDLENKKYSEKKISGNLEVASLTGVLAYLDGKPVLHIHVCLSDENFNVFAGHLERGVVSATLEVGFQESEGLTRKFNENIGLNLLTNKEG